RAREFKADAIGAGIASPEAMIGALERVHGIPAKPTGVENRYGYLMFRGGRMGALFSTHPPLKRRTDALRRGVHLNELARKR
ncbi:protease, partial [bacterium M00.F.Ca.ET.177.01.1.1]